MVWRWHFFAALFVAPFAVLLALTGAIYLWRPQYEAWRYHSFFDIPVGPRLLSSQRQLEAVLTSNPGMVPRFYSPPRAAGKTAEVVIRPHPLGFDSPWAMEGDKAVYVNPYSGEVVGSRELSQDFMAQVRAIHASILMGTGGKALLELSATWLLVMLITGFYLWWPRAEFRFPGFLWPRWSRGRQVLVRDLHVVPAVWISGLVLLLIVTGMPWTTVTSRWIETVSAFMGQGQPEETDASAHHSQLVGGWSPFIKDQKIRHHLERVSSSPAQADQSLPRVSLDRILALADELRLETNYQIVFPRGPDGVFSIITSDVPPTKRAFIHIDQYSAKVLADVRYEDFGLLAKPIVWGIPLHEGRLFGLANQILGFIACLGVIALVASAGVLWWQRRPSRQTFLRAPGAAPAPLPFLFWVTIFILAVALPLFAASAAVLLLFTLTIKRFHRPNIDRSS